MSDRRFFGEAARPIAEVEMRRHPLAFTMYGIVCFLGLIFILHLYGPNRSDHDLFPGVSSWAIFTWKWMMVVGGAGAVTALAVNPRHSPHWPDLADLLHIEAVFAIVAAFGMLVYIVVVVHLQGWDDSYQALVIYGALIFGHVARGVQAIIDAIRLEGLAQALLEESRRGRA
jgi:hypothetical protein